MSEATTPAGRPAFARPLEPPPGDDELYEEDATPQTQAAHPYAAARSQRPVRLSIDVPLEVATALDEIVMAMKRQGQRRASKAGLIRIMIDRLLGDEEFRREVLRASRTL